MAERVVVNEQYLQDVANSIRAKLKTEDKYKPSEFSEKIDEMNIATPVTKGFIVNEFDSDGYPINCELIGFDNIPNYYFYSIDNRGLFKELINLKLPSNILKISDYVCYYNAKLKTIN